MHLNTTSAFNVNYKIAVTCVKLHCHFHKNVLMNYIKEHSFQSMCSKCPPPAHTHNLSRSRHWSIVASIMSEVQSNQVCVKRFRSTSTSRIFSYTHCCIAPQIS